MSKHKTQKSKNGGRDINSAQQASLISSSKVEQITILIIGLVITSLVYIALSLFVNSIINANISKTRQDTMENIVSGINNAQNAVRTVSTLIYNSREATLKSAISHVKSIPNLSVFEHLVIAREIRPEVWKFEDIYIHPPTIGGKKFDRWTAGSDFSQHVKRINLINETGVVAFGEFSGLGAGEQVRNHIDKNIVFVKPVQTGNTKAGLLIGITRVSLLAKSNIAGAYSEDNLNGLNVSILQRDAQTTNQIKDEILLYDSKTDNLDDNSMEHRFSAASRIWSVSISPELNSSEKFLLYLPLYFAGGGVLITMLILLYIRSRNDGIKRTINTNNFLRKTNSNLELDILEKTKILKALKKERIKNREIIDSISDIIFEVNSDMKILFLNSAWSAITGIDVDKCLGKDLLSFTKEQDQKDLKRKVSALAKECKDRAQIKILTSMRKKSGVLFDVEIYFTAIKKAKFCRVVGTIIDVQERQNAKAALVDAEQKFRAIVKNAANGIYQLTPDGLYISANPAFAKILGYSSTDELIKKTAQTRFSIYANSSARAVFIRNLEAKGMAAESEVELIKKDGTHIWVSENARIVRDDESHNSGVLYYEGSIEDVTARRNAEVELRKAKVQAEMASRSKSEFLANMSHELRTPLNSIIGFADIIKNEVFGGHEKKEYKEYANDIHENGQHLLKIINEILDISRIEAGDRQLSESIVNIDNVVKGATKSMSKKALAKNIKVSCDIDEKINVIGEERALKQMVSNLLSNAIKFTPSEGSVSISTSFSDAGELLFSITDTGIGMDEDEIKSALSPFGQVDTKLDRAGSGTGFGLTLVQTLIALHGGEFDIVSQKGIGTTVTITFPKTRIENV